MGPVEAGPRAQQLPGASPWGPGSGGPISRRDGRPQLVGVTPQSQRIQSGFVGADTGTVRFNRLLKSPCPN